MHETGACQGSLRPGKFSPPYSVGARQRMGEEMAPGAGQHASLAFTPGIHSTKPAYTHCTPHTQSPLSPRTTPTLEMLLEKRVEDWVGRREGRSVYPMQVTPPAWTTLPGTVVSTLPPCSAARSTAGGRVDMGWGRYAGEESWALGHTKAVRI